MCHNYYFCDSISDQLEGADSRKRSVEAGLIETVLKLVDSHEPIQVQYQFISDYFLIVHYQSAG